MKKITKADLAIFIMDALHDGMFFKNTCDKIIDEFWETINYYQERPVKFQYRSVEGSITEEPREYDEGGSLQEIKKEPLILLSESFAFSKWCSHNKWMYMKYDHKWHNHFETKTDEELYELFLQDYELWKEKLKTQ